MSSTQIRPPWKNYLALCKPKVVALIIFTAVVGMFLATPDFPPLQPLLFGTLGIGLAAASAAAINHFLDQKVDAKMARTQNRPLPQGNISSQNVIIFAISLGVIAMLILVLWVNYLTATLTFLSLIGYAIVYTVYLKHATPQNIVIGGAAGAAPPVLGWCAVTDTIHPYALLLFLIIFIWTPPHFWALAIAKRKEYAKASIPMLPVTHGAEFTRLQVLLYTILLLIVTLLPYLTGMSGLIYLATVIPLNLGFLYFAVQMIITKEDRIAMKTFGFSIIYLTGIFSTLLIDHYFPL
ncbi:MAG TPA: protoheme IX farnesyltransferase [Methylococcaceae bacterium]|jgi:protoheme IX farnesyltransferase|nr:protoheme IX farnesyltransferase [Methylococcaceae bacterium]HIN69188.1 protoheme IX farnesyltransferase [Methylococcales bacterium]HIA46291.1 protoheme IX farnesyltransferase [Methylococcaceae bacterium]HIB61878.1 protoheme IX farnesyltransferase [Methylococcaceae bacterium]HIO13424.1 protoheme IX farnesyltransferase [Methylococcales bacterium]